jgi:hypothetical protein
VAHTGSTRAALEQIVSALAAIDHAAREGSEDDELLELVELAETANRGTEALLRVVLAEAERRQAAQKVRGTPLTTLLAVGGQLSGREAAGLVFDGLDISRYPGVQSAALEGRITIRQGRAIVRVMQELPETLSDEQRREAERLLLAQAATTTAYKLEGMTASITASVAPDQLEGPDAIVARLEEQRRRAKMRRRLTFRSDDDGSVRFWGSLPDADAEIFVKTINGYVEADRRATAGAWDVRDAKVAPRLSEQRRADALMSALTALQDAGRTPGSGGDRPRVVVVMRQSDLMDEAEARGMLLSGEKPLSPGELRQLLCEAEVLPAVLGTQSEILDLGRSVRLVSGALRRGLSLRDGECVFPGCEQPDASCEAHHIVPWSRGGETSLSNLVLLCRHHHSLVEPRSGVDPPSERWCVRIRDDGRPEVLPPHRVDRNRTPHVHMGPLTRLGHHEVA